MIYELQRHPVSRIPDLASPPTFGPKRPWKLSRCGHYWWRMAECGTIYQVDIATGEPRRF